jgi:cation-transporting ATPase 13A1
VWLSDGKTRPPKIFSPIRARPRPPPPTPPPFNPRATMGPPTLDSLVLLRPQSLFLRLDVVPFALLYAVVGTLFADTAALPFPGVAQLALLAAVLVHALAFLSQQWFVSARRAIAFTDAAGGLESATHVYVPFASTAQKAAIVPLQRRGAGVGAGSGAGDGGAAAALAAALQRVGNGEAGDTGAAAAAAAAVRVCRSLLALPRVRFTYNSLQYELDDASEGAARGLPPSEGGGGGGGGRRGITASAAPLPDALPLPVYSGWKGWPAASGIVGADLSASSSSSSSSGPGGGAAPPPPTTPVDALRIRYGRNRVDVPVPEFWALFKEHAVAPFFVFQIFCVALWMLDEYFWYPLFMLFTLGGLEATMVGVRIATAKQLRGMRPPPGPLYVYRGSKWAVLMSDELVPLDLVSLSREPPPAPPGFRTAAAAAGGAQRGSARNPVPAAPAAPPKPDVPADVLLLGGSVVVNEAMLTGESAPQMKEGVATLGGDEEDDADENADDAEGKGARGSDSRDLVLNAFLEHSDRSHSHCVVYGGTQIVQHQGVLESEGSASATAARHIPAPPDGGAVAVVLRTGPHTSQGELLRTIMHASEPVSSASDREGLLFILGLLVFGLGAAAYVLHHGLADPTRDKWKLILHCVMIITSVVPPELPIELSLAVNASLAALNKRGIFCVEPFRVPLAGKITACAFDKTGTLTSDEFTVEGVHLGAEGAGALVPAPGAPAAAKLVIAGCHAIVAVKSAQKAAAAAAAGVLAADTMGVEIVGDPIEKAALAGIRWTVDARGLARPASYLADAAMAAVAAQYATFSTGGGGGSGSGGSGGSSSSSSGNGGSSVEVLRRWAFSSALKRMTALVRAANAAGLAAPQPPKGGAGNGGRTSAAAALSPSAAEAFAAANTLAPSAGGLYAVCKGAPEVIELLLASVPPGYTSAHQRLAASGSRVLALAYKPLPASLLSTLAGAAGVRRDEAEKDLVFAGFLVASCPLKTDSKRTVAELRASAHRVLMITGDAPLTALAVARELGFAGAAHAQTQDPSVLDADAEGKGLRLTRVVTSAVGGGGSQGSGSGGGEDDAPLADAGLSAATALPAGLPAHEGLVRLLRAGAAAASSSSSASPAAPPLVCVTGRALEYLERTESPLNVAEVCRIAQVFARVSPAQKERVVELLASYLGEATAMVGDGSNDTGALKRAAIGLAVVSNPAFERRFDALRLQTLQRRAEGRAEYEAAQRAGDIRAMSVAMQKIGPGGPGDDEDPDALAALLREDKAAQGADAGAGAGPAAAAAAAEDPAMAALRTAALPAGGTMDRVRKRLLEIEAEARTADGGMAGGPGAPVAALGDASMAAPFTSKMPTPASLVHILRQGRCTLVTTHQMFKILAVNCLILSYQLSVLHLNNVRSGDAQQTFLGMSAAAFFMFLSWARPVPKLSVERPAVTVFNPALLLSILSQFIVHLASLALVAHVVGFDPEKPVDTAIDNATATALASAASVVEAEGLLGQDLLEKSLFAAGDAAAAAATAAGGSGGGSESVLGYLFGLDAEAAALDETIPPSTFKPNIINSAVFLVTTAAQTCTFLVSYHGLPFMEPLSENKLLVRGAALVYCVCLLGALGLSQDLNEVFQLIPLPDGTQRVGLAALIVADLALCWGLERVIRKATGAPGGGA